MSKNIIYIGIDGGGTKTKAVVENSNGTTIGIGIGGASNVRLSVEKSWDSIYTAIDKALDGSGIALDSDQYEFNIGMGLAGVTIVDAKEKFLAQPHPFRHLVLDTDAHIACLGANDGEDALIISIGTGVIGYMIHNDKSYRIGGWGFPHADTGGGAWIGMEAVRLAFSYADGTIPESKVLKNIYSKFDSNIVNMCQWACKASATEFGTIAPLVIQGLENSDPYSIQLVQSAATEIDLMINSLRSKVDDTTSEIPCILMGGVSSFLLPYLEADNLKVNNDKDTAAKGAMIFIRKHVENQN